MRPLDYRAESVETLRQHAGEMESRAAERRAAFGEDAAARRHLADARDMRIRIKWQDAQTRAIETALDSRVLEFTRQGLELARRYSRQSIMRGGTGFRWSDELHAAATRPGLARDSTIC